ncbi:Holliday junction branch migration protein RuvA [Parasphingopyxis sp. CP4]|uniref:Holliday junction branch migration protein RuvA n=1 Tax=Parasphingopyxis sp. CP4 TaxID=2724527 RepID=UPI0015A108A9|nr:Holliday junction branch migration protein RuvA [Parasphingopyxis sp. CP4]QLC22540.1 Holliday junction branch migration protein RuvA [Parasphingopyxis sp. CP4]
MIAKLKGILETSAADHAVIDVQGVGYQVAASSRTLDALGPVGGDVTIHTEMLVGDDFIRLIGFASASERDWFRLLGSVQGVGSKVALAILSTLETGEIQTAIAADDAAMLARTPGVGPKLASRIANELKDKVGGIATAPGGVAAPAPGGASSDAVSALLNLGFKPAEASAAVAAAQGELGADAGLDALVRTALKKAAK